MTLQENYKKLFKGRPSSNDQKLLKEASSITNDPILKKYGFDRTDSPDTLKGKLATRANLKGVTTVAYFNNSKWNLPTNPFDRNKIRDKIHTTLAKTLSKHIGGKLNTIWTIDNANLPDNITALAMSGGDATSITIDQGNVNGMDRDVTGTYNGKSFELETSDGMTSIYLNGKLVNDEDEEYDDILNAVNDQGYELQENYKRLFTMKKRNMMNLKTQYKRLFEGRVSSNDNMLLQSDKYKSVINEVKFKKGDTVIPTVGPHAGVPHKIIAVLQDINKPTEEIYNIQPIGLQASKNKYRLGAVGAHESQLKNKDI